MRLIPDLKSLANHWSENRSLSRSRLGSIVVRDGRFFERIDGGASCTIATLERFITFFRDPQNWVDGQIPGAAADILKRDSFHTPTDTTAPAPLSGGNEGAISAPAPEVVETSA